MLIHGQINTDDFKGLRTRGGHVDALAGSHTWIVAADEKRAAVFSKAGQQIEALGHFTAHEGELTEKPGAAEALGHNKPDPRFARELAAWLDKAVQQKAFDSLVLIAGPRMLGELRKELSAVVKKHVTDEINKDVANFSDEKLIQELPRLIPGPDRVH